MTTSARRWPHRLGEEHPCTGGALDSLAADPAAGGHFAEAMPLFVQARQVLRNAVGIEHSGGCGTRGATCAVDGFRRPLSTSSNVGFRGAR